MNTKTKKILIISGLALDVAITVFLFVVAIVMLATLPDDKTIKAAGGMLNIYESNKNMITYLQAHPTTYLLTCVIPLIVLLIGNIILLVLYLNKAGKRKTELSDLSEDQKAALRAEILKDMEEPKEDK